MTILNYCSRWESGRLATIFAENTDKNTLLSFTDALQFRYGEIRPKPTYELTDDLKETYRKYALVRPNDIMLNGLNLNYDFVTQRVAQVKVNGIITSAYISLRPREGVSAQYYTYLFKSLDAMKVFNGMGTGIRLTLSYNLLKNLELPVPPRAEQEQIVRYLDWQVSKINKLIAAKKHKISVLEEERQALIDALVLRSPHSIETKDIKLAWDAPIPSTWSAYKFNQLFDFGKGLAITKANLLSSGIPVISYGQVHSKTNSGTGINDSLIRYVSDDYIYNAPNSLVHEGDFIFADTSEDFLGVGNCVYVDCNDTLFAGYHTVIARPKDNQKRRYLAYLFLSSAWRYSLRKQVNGVKVFSITQRILKNTCVILPPKEEQEEIVNILDLQCARIDALINATRIEIERFHEYRTRLISDVVTGQIDVRGIVVPDFQYIADEADVDSRENEDSDVDETEDE